MVADTLANAVSNASGLKKVGRCFIGSI
jgi:hypothetical protein